MEETSIAERLRRCGIIVEDTRINNRNFPPCAVAVDADRVTVVTASRLGLPICATTEQVRLAVQMSTQYARFARPEEYLSVEERHGVRQRGFIVLLGAVSNTGAIPEVLIIKTNPRTGERSAVLGAAAPNALWHADAAFVVVRRERHIS